MEKSSPDHGILKLLFYAMLQYFNDRVYSSAATCDCLKGKSQPGFLSGSCLGSNSADTSSLMLPSVTYVLAAGGLRPFQTDHF